MSELGTLLVGQSGGATTVINASLVGVIEGALASGCFGRVLGMRNGIDGLLAERFVDLRTQPRDVLDRVRCTPSAALGTGRRKLREDELDLALDLLQQHGVRAFVYIGGNDSADTAHRLHLRAVAAGYELAVISVPKTIDNDLPETDYCPGYPSLARFLAHAVRDATYDTLASPQLYPVKFVDVMGRDAGWVPAACALGFSADEGDLLPLLYLPECPPADADAILAEIEAQVQTRGWSVAVVPETLRDASGRHLGGDEPEYVDPFGHPYHAQPAVALTRLVNQRLGLRARFERPGTAARMSIALASPVDLDGAERAGRAAAELAARGVSDVMTTLVRAGDAPYRWGIGTAPLAKIANRVRAFPEPFIGADGRSVTAAFRDYALPLLGPDPFPSYGRLLDKS
ncbi:MAG: ATP-dependent phosphofructokinase / diphosphate-dependent phosphofructokinase [Thermomicrobiales bacterium]|nr:ATP-dependent phosphofructokinase / diphosphate-dependent phosphofructokinase [Thermomicrobiales bacterium]